MDTLFVGADTGADVGFAVVDVDVAAAVVVVVVMVVVVVVVVVDVVVAVVVAEVAEVAVAAAAVAYAAAPEASLTGESFAFALNPAAAIAATVVVIFAVVAVGKPGKDIVASQMAVHKPSCHIHMASLGADSTSGKVAIAAVEESVVAAVLGADALAAANWVVSYCSSAVVLEDEVILGAETVVDSAKVTLAEGVQIEALFEALPPGNLDVDTDVARQHFPGKSDDCSVDALATVAFVPPLWQWLVGVLHQKDPPLYRAL